MWVSVSIAGFLSTIGRGTLFFARISSYSASTTVVLEMLRRSLNSLAAVFTPFSSMRAARVVTLFLREISKIIASYVIAPLAGSLCCLIIAYNSNDLAAKAMTSGNVTFVLATLRDCAFSFEPILNSKWGKCELMTLPRPHTTHLSNEKYMDSPKQFQFILIWSGCLQP